MRRPHRRAAPSSPMLTPADPAPARRVGRYPLARASRARSHGRLHRKGQRPPPRTARLPARPGITSPTTTGKSMRRSQKTNGRPAMPLASPWRAAQYLWCELYFQTVHDRSVSPAGQHTMSVFAQYVPYKFARGSWDDRRAEVRQLAMDSLGRFCTNLDHAVIDMQVLGPPDIEKALASPAAISSRANVCRSICGPTVSPPARP